MRNAERDWAWVAYAFMAAFLGTVLGAIGGLLLVLAALRVLLPSEFDDDPHGMVVGILSLFGLAGGGFLGGLVAFIREIWGWAGEHDLSRSKGPPSV